MAEGTETHPRCSCYVNMLSKGWESTRRSTVIIAWHSTACASMAPPGSLLCPKASTLGDYTKARCRARAEQRQPKQAGNPYAPSASALGALCMNGGEHAESAAILVLHPWQPCYSPGLGWGGPGRSLTPFCEAVGAAVVALSAPTCSSTPQLPAVVTGLSQHLWAAAAAGTQGSLRTGIQGRQAQRKVGWGEHGGSAVWR